MKLIVTKGLHNRSEKIDGHKVHKVYGVGDTFDGNQRELDACSDRLAAAPAPELEPTPTKKGGKKGA